MKTLNLTPDTLHRVLTLTNAAALPDPLAGALLFDLGHALYTPEDEADQ